MNQHAYECSQCDKTFKTKGMERRHWKDVHDGRLGTNKPTKNIGPVKKLHCELCDFKGYSDVQMRKHSTVRHTVPTLCYFWANGSCRKGDLCNFSHSSQHPPTPPPCRYADRCGFWPYCKFSHEGNSFCRFQEFCQNQFCNFVHVDREGTNAFLGFGRKTQNQFQRSQPAPMWRPW